MYTVTCHVYDHCQQDLMVSHCSNLLEVLKGRNATTTEGELLFEEIYKGDLIKRHKMNCGGITRPGSNFKSTISTWIKGEMLARLTRKSKVPSGPRGSWTVRLVLCRRYRNDQATIQRMWGICCRPVCMALIIWQNGFLDQWSYNFGRYLGDENKNVASLRTHTLTKICPPNPHPFALCLEDTTNTQQETVTDSALSLYLMGQ